MKVAVVILNWNTVDYLRRFLPPLLESVAAFNDGNHTNDNNGTDSELPDAADDWAEIVVADSASTDGSMEMVAEEFPSVRRIPLAKNYGFTGGYNRALKELEENPTASAAEAGKCGAVGHDGMKYDLFVLLNSDIEVTRGWLRPLVEWMKAHPECGACGPKLHSWYERDKFEYAGAAGGLIDRFGYPFCRGRVMGKVETDRGQYDAPADVLWVTGACLMVRASVWKALGGLDDRFFAHMEEIDLCWRIQIEGRKVTVVPESTVFHLGGGTLPQNSPQKLYLNYRNNLLLLDNNLARTVGRRKAAVRIFFRKILDGCAAAAYLLSFRTDYVSAVWRAHRDAARLIAGKHDGKRGVKDDGVYAADKRHCHETHSVAGLYSGCMIPRALLGLKIHL